MSYIESVIRPGETVLYTANIHPAIYIKAGVLGAVGLFLLAGSPILGVPVLCFAILAGLNAHLFRVSTELAITSRRVVGKYGFIRRGTIDVGLGKVEGATMGQGLFDRLFGAGSIVVNGTGGHGVPIPYIESPMGFKNALSDAMEAHSEKR